MNLAKLQEMVRDGGPGMLPSIGSQRVRHSWPAEQQLGYVFSAPCGCRCIQFCFCGHLADQLDLAGPGRHHSHVWQWLEWWQQPGYTFLITQQTSLDLFTRQFGIWVPKAASKDKAHFTLFIFYFFLLSVLYCSLADSYCYDSFQSKGTQTCTYMHPFSPKHPFHPGSY